MLTLNGLFHRSKSVINQNDILVLLHPTILPTPEVATQLSKAEKDKMPTAKRAELQTQEEEANRLKRLEKNVKSELDFAQN